MTYAHNAAATVERARSAGAGTEKQRSLAGVATAEALVSISLLLSELLWHLRMTNPVPDAGAQTGPADDDTPADDTQEEQNEASFYDSEGNEI